MSIYLIRTNIEPTTLTPLPGFEPGSQAPQAHVLSKLYYKGVVAIFLYLERYKGI